MPYGEPVGGGLGAEYRLMVTDTQNTNLAVQVNFFSTEPDPTEAGNDDFMQRVINALAAGPNLRIASAVKAYPVTQDITPTTGG